MSPVNWPLKSRLLLWLTAADPVYTWADAHPHVSSNVSGARLSCGKGKVINSQRVHVKVKMPHTYFLGPEAAWSPVALEFTWCCERLERQESWSQQTWRPLLKGTCSQSGQQDVTGSCTWVQSDMCTCSGALEALEYSYTRSFGYKGCLTSVNTCQPLLTTGERGGLIA